WESDDSSKVSWSLISAKGTGSSNVHGLQIIHAGLDTTRIGMQINNTAVVSDVTIYNSVATAFQFRGTVLTESSWLLAARTTSTGAFPIFRWGAAKRQNITDCRAYDYNSQGILFSSAYSNVLTRCKFIGGA